jgi:hypothetical protein
MAASYALSILNEEERGMVWWERGVTQAKGIVTDAELMESGINDPIDVVGDLDELGGLTLGG